MEMIASEVSGVAFSLNPSNNDYDEAVINSNFGVGETVVSGVINPDFFLVNKPKKLILSKKLGTKEHFLFLNSSGGLVEKQDEAKSRAFSLTEVQVLEITQSLEQIESLYDNTPIDIEWAYFDGKLFILQARPITTFLKLPKKMLTEKYEKRLLYLDATLVVQGFDKPFSILGASLIENLLSKLGECVLGDSNVCNIMNGLIGIIGGKIFFNLANVFTKASKETIGKNFKNMNPNVGNIILNVFEAEKKYFSSENFFNLSVKESEEEKAKRLSFHRYTSDIVPECLKYSELGMLWRMPVIKFIFPNFFLNKIKSGILSGIADYEENLNKYEKIWENKSQSLAYILENLFGQLTYLISQRLMPAMGGGIPNGINKIKELFENKIIIFADESDSSSKQSHKNANTFRIDELLGKNKFTKNEVKFLIENLIRSLPNNITTQMALDLFQLAELLYENNNKMQPKYSQIGFDKFYFYFVSGNDKYIKKNKKLRFCRLNLIDDSKLNEDIIKLEDEGIQRLFDDDFLYVYNKFIETYGVRGEMELDIVNTRYRENPKFIISQIFNFYESLNKKENYTNKNKESLIHLEINLNEKDDSALNPKEVFLEAERNRPKIFKKLLSLAEKYEFSSDFKKAYDLVINLAGYRETPKYYIIKTLSLLREIVLEISEIFLKLNLLENKSEIFKLKIIDVINLLIIK